jgi:hypothetical protein
MRWLAEEGQDGVLTAVLKPPGDACKVTPLTFILEVFSGMKCSRILESFSKTCRKKWL